jgi:DNA-binding MarR family transcriptional regulator
VLVRLTPEGKAAVDGAFGALLAAEAELIAALPAGERSTLASLLRTLLAPFSPPED